MVPRNLHFCGETGARLHVGDNLSAGSRLSDSESVAHTHTHTHTHTQAALIKLKYPHIQTQEVMMYISCSVGPRCAHRTSAKPEWNIHTGAPICISQRSSTAKFGRWKYFLCCAPHPCSCCLPELWLFDTVLQNNKDSSGLTKCLEVQKTSGI